MKDKYIEEKYPQWYEFGSSGDGKVDIADPFTMTLATVRKQDAVTLISHHNRVVQALVNAVQMLSKHGISWEGEGYYE